MDNSAFSQFEKIGTNDNTNPIGLQNAAGIDNPADNQYLMNLGNTMQVPAGFPSADSIISGLSPSGDSSLAQPTSSSSPLDASTLMQDLEMAALGSSLFGGGDPTSQTSSDSSTSADPFAAFDGSQNSNSQAQGDPFAALDGSQSSNSSQQAASQNPLMEVVQAVAMIGQVVDNGILGVLGIENPSTDSSSSSSSSPLDSLI